LNIVVIGGGAAGFFGAITCAEANPRASVTLLEKGGDVLAKVRVSGGGRCNLTHACFDPKQLVRNYPRGQRALLGPFHKFQPRDTVAWFEKHGVPVKTEPDGRMFPVSDTSFSIIQALKDAAQSAGVEVRTQAGPVSVARASSQFLLTFSNGKTMLFDRVLLATGSAPQGHQWAKELGHTIETPVPSLFTFNVPDSRLRGLEGISVEKARVRLTAGDFEQTGPVLVTHWGFSGPAVLKLSAWAARFLSECGYQAEFQINWVGDKPAVVERKILDFKADNARKSIASKSLFELPRRLWERLLHIITLPDEHRWADLSNVQLARLVAVLTADTYHMRGKTTFKEEFVTCGGVRLDEVNFQTMESRLCPGLHFAGEILDIDGVTGGFNFQNAWTTGWLAGRAMASAGVL
jgi:predicted Rossmann fold flavoprotein